ncbi:hypothetical protein [Nocardioides currus]|uniref:EamA domain-containing protein n=1 Tax=Nocardioides currus TaxID=2133958 RepID=A0A2R7YWF7_9ACTN|nr:hypothetical protein [Nocardioides currus]PUA80653.1 hypothetical protein C7S10_12935 [Nocardioides currus]
MILGLFSALASAALFGVAAVVQASAIRAVADDDLGLRGFVHAALRSWPMLGVVAAYLAGFVLHAVALVLLPLYLAQASISLSLPVTAVVSAVVLHERLGPTRCLAVVAVIAGLVLVAAGAGSVEQTTSTATLTALGAGWLLVLVAGTRPSLARGAGILGAWSGLGYAGSAVTTRGLSADEPLLSLLALALVSALGLVAFWLYSVALRRTDVAASTGPLIVVQTCVPALIGVAAFGDTTRPGWELAVVVGLVVSIVGAVRLGRDTPATV